MTVATTDAIRRSMINCSKGDARRMTLVDGRISLHTAPRAGAAGRAGDSVGTDVCDDLACPGTTRWERSLGATVVPDLGLPVDERVAALRTRVDAFVAAVRRPAI